MELSIPRTSPGSVPRIRSSSTAARSQSWEDILTSAHLRQIFAVLEVAEDARNGERFKETVVDAIATVFELPNVTFFFGPTYLSMFRDPTPLLTGISDVVFRDYQERWFDKDIFALPSARRLLAQNGFATLDDFVGLPAPQKEYVEELLRRDGIGPASALHLRFANGEAIIGMFDKDRSWDLPDIVAMRLLAKHLGSNSRSIVIGPGDDALDFSRALSPRQLEVANLVSDGLTNAQIAEIMCVTEMTVKKYVSRIFDATGVSNRSMLATAMLRFRR